MLIRHKNTSMNTSYTWQIGLLKILLDVSDTIDWQCEACMHMSKTTHAKRCQNFFYKLVQRQQEHTVLTLLFWSKNSILLENGFSIFFGLTIKIIYNVWAVNFWTKYGNQYSVQCKKKLVCKWYYVMEKKCNPYIFDWYGYIHLGKLCLLENFAYISGKSPKRRKSYLTTLVTFTRCTDTHNCIFAVAVSYFQDWF